MEDLSESSGFSLKTERHTKEKKNGGGGRETQEENKKTNNTTTLQKEKTQTMEVHLPKPLAHAL